MKKVLVPLLLATLLPLENSFSPRYVNPEIKNKSKLSAISVQADDGIEIKIQENSENQNTEFNENENGIEGLEQTTGVEIEPNGDQNTINQPTEENRKEMENEVEGEMGGVVPSHSVASISSLVSLQNCRRNRPFLENPLLKGIPTYQTPSNSITYNVSLRNVL